MIYPFHVSASTPVRLKMLRTTATLDFLLAGTGSDQYAFQGGGSQKKKESRLGSLLTPLAHPCLGNRRSSILLR